MEDNSYLESWIDHEDNPLIEPPWPEWLIADPTFVPPRDSPDGKWHLFAHSLRGIHHFTSRDGVQWRRKGKIGPGMRPFIYKEGGTFYMFFEYLYRPPFRSRIEMRTSPDLWRWGEMTTVLEPTLPWEGRISQYTGNPCLIRTDDGYRLYYSAGAVFLRDLGFCEPRYIGVAFSKSAGGPFRKHPPPVISPARDDRYRNLGAGAIKVIYDERQEIYLGFNNGIYRDDEGRTRSAILLLSSHDGLDWEYLYPEPIIAPGGQDWKRALVYQLDVKSVDGELRLYYNARDGWMRGTERIGLATCGEAPKP